mmetsp:Transcript_4372/g.7186  ORF Transcript_4372/g.7186 Transcript_4372/m.7186 type:complete len:104 (-) Transcript_4372:8-319(-)
MSGPKARELQIRTTINQRFIETNEKEKLKEFLRTKLVECGWRDEMKTYCREVLRAKENVVAEELISEITPKGKAQVPEKVKQEALAKIKTFLVNYAQGQQGDK